MGKAIFINQASYVKDTLNLSGGTLTGIINYNGDLSNNFSGNTLITKDYADSGTTSLETALSSEISTTNSEIISLESEFGNINFSSLETEISTEISNRIDGDSSLTTAISSEISITDSEVTSLETEISNGFSSLETEMSTVHASLETEIGNFSTTMDGLTDTSIDNPVEGNLLVYDNNSSKWINTNTISKDTTIIGDLYVSGTTTTINTSDMNVADNIILINSGETGNGVSLIYSGLEVDRGTLTNYRFVLDDTVTSNPLFKIGEIGDYQSVATRQDIPVSSGITYWNDTSKRFDTSTGLIFDGTTLKYDTTITLNNDVDITHKKYVDDEIFSLETEISNGYSSLETSISNGDSSLTSAISTEISSTNEDISSLETELSTDVSSLESEIGIDSFSALTTNSSVSWNTSTGLNKTWSINGSYTLTLTNLSNGMSGDVRINVTATATITLAGSGITFLGNGSLSSLETGVYHLVWVCTSSSTVEWNIAKYI